MNRVHVCLVSDQTIPNILAIQHFKPAKIIFCTTEKMENQDKSDAIIDTLGLYGLDYSTKSHKVFVDQDCLEDCELKLSDIAQKYSNHKFVINLTGGTKIMVIAAYNVFQKHNAQMIYTPIPKNQFVEIFPRKGNCKSPIPLNLRLTVEAYLTAYGVKVKNKNKLEPLKTNAKKNEKISKWMVDNYDAIESLLSSFIKEELNKHRGDRKDYRFKMNYSYMEQKEKELLDDLLGFEIRNNSIEKMLTKYEVRFLTGDWLSDFCYNEISKLSIDSCVTGIELVSPKGADNEFDVLFTKDNTLYIIECKSLKQEYDKDADILYKISALQQDFGLKIDGFLVSTARNIIDKQGRIKEHIIRRSKQCKAEIIHPDNIKNFGLWIKNNVKGL